MGGIAVTLIMICHGRFQEENQQPLDDSTCGTSDLTAQITVAEIAAEMWCLSSAALVHHKILANKFPLD